MPFKNIIVSHSGTVVPVSNLFTVKVSVLLPSLSHVLIILFIEDIFLTLLVIHAALTIVYSDNGINSLWLFKRDSIASHEALRGKTITT